MHILSRIFPGWAKAFYSAGSLRNALFKTKHPKKQPIQLIRRKIYTNKKVVCEIPGKSLS